MNHADPNTMRARARQATEILKTQLLGTGTIEPLVALYFDDHIEQVEFQDPSVLEHFDVRTARSFDYLRTLVRIKNPQAAMITLDVRMGPFESDERDVLADTTAIFLMLDSPLLTIQVLLPYTRSWREDRRVKCSLHGDARRRGRYAVPAFQDFPGCTRGRVLNGLIAYCYDDSAIAQITCSLNRLIARSAPSTVFSRFSACLIASNSTESPACGCRIEQLSETPLRFLREALAIEAAGASR